MVREVVLITVMVIVPHLELIREELGSLGKVETEVMVICLLGEGTCPLVVAEERVQMVLMDRVVNLVLAERVWHILVLPMQAAAAAADGDNRELCIHMVVAVVLVAVVLEALPQQGDLQ